jgi:hypothetical protein
MSISGRALLGTRGANGAYSHRLSNLHLKGLELRVEGEYLEDWLAMALANYSS